MGRLEISLKSKDGRSIEKVVKDLDKAMKGAASSFRSAVTVALGLGGNEIRNKIISSIQNSPRSGRIQRRYDPKRDVSPSIPGHPPRSDTGDMVRSILSDVDRRMLVLEVGSILGEPPYPRYLEDGTKKMKARPWLEPATKVKVPAMVAQIGKILNQEILHEIRKRGFK